MSVFGMDPATVALLVGVGTLLIERAFAWMGKIKKIKMCGGEIKMEGASDSTTTASKEPTPEPPDKPQPKPKPAIPQISDPLNVK